MTLSENGNELLNKLLVEVNIKVRTLERSLQVSLDIVDTLNSEIIEAERAWKNSGFLTELTILASFTMRKDLKDELEMIKSYKREQYILNLSSTLITSSI